MTPLEARSRFRAGLKTPTAGWCPGYAQANLLAVPADLAYDMLLFAQRNPKPCPILDVGDPGATSLPIFAGDLRTDLPGYVVYENGAPVAEVTDVSRFWRDDLVPFLIGCSFTFEDALIKEDIPVRHLEMVLNVPMYRTSVPCRPAGRLSGPLVVSMRPIPAARVADAVRVSGRYPQVHGAPVHIGDPAGLLRVDRALSPVDRRYARPFNAKSNKTRLASLLRRYGMGVPDAARALHSATDALTLIAEARSILTSGTATATQAKCGR